MTDDSELENLQCYPFHLPSGRPNPTTHNLVFVMPQAFLDMVAEVGWLSLSGLAQEASEEGDPVKATQAAGVVDTTIPTILEWQEFIREELESLTWQEWQVTYRFERICGDVQFICYWQGRNITMPPLSFHHLATGDARQELKERAKQVAEARALIEQRGRQ